MFLSLLNYGASNNMIQAILGSGDWDKNKEILERASLINSKYEKTFGEEIYFLLPFISTMAEKLLLENKNLYFKFHIKICCFYRKLLNNMMKC